MGIVGSPYKLGGSREMGTDGKRFVTTRFHKNRRLGFLKRHRSKRMSIFRKADQVGLHIDCC